ncbi:MAG: putative protein-disulfide isomerase [Saprospiraceae bacterium]|jgi:putative protein-disulfide isomerase
MKNLLFLLTFLIFQTSCMSQEKATLIYIGDPMCSWCYGFVPELSKAIDDLDEVVNIQVVMGGLRPYNTQKMTDLADFLKEHWEEVNDRSNQPFSYEILKENYAYDTEPPSRACLVIREMKPELELDFFKALQSLFYVDNKDMNVVESYLPLVKEMGLNGEEFKQKFASEEMKTAVKADFELAGRMGVRGFPAMVLKHGEEYILISNGYTSADKIVNSVERVLN